jgi:FMN phosphatase YigB (HAD superfamily)
MTVIKNECVVMYDVDDTLVREWYEAGSAFGIALPEEEHISILDPTTNNFVRRHPVEKHIELLKKHKARGFTVVVWSQGGWAWAEAVVKALGLEAYVDHVMSKPVCYVDDLPVQKWMTQRIYLR